MARSDMEMALVNGELQPPEHRGQRATCPRCGREVRAHFPKSRRQYWQHPELSPICHAADLARAGLTFEQWEAGIRPPKRR